MLLHYCQLVILDVLREQLFVKETQLLPRNLFFLSFSWLQGSEKPKVPGHLQSLFLGSSLWPRKGHRTGRTMPGHLPPHCPRVDPCLNSPGYVFLTWSSEFPALEVVWHPCSSCGVTAGALQWRWLCHGLLGAKTFLSSSFRADLPEIIPKLWFVSMNCMGGELE